MIQSNALRYAEVSGRYFQKFGRTPSDDGFGFADDQDVKDLADFFERVFGQPPEKTIEMFKGKGITTTWNWNDLEAAAQKESFTVAKVMNADILQLIRDSIATAMHEGETFASWKQDLTAKLKANGWYGPKDVVNPETGKVETVDLSSGSRMKTIFQTNMQSSYMTSRYTEMQKAVSRRPYLQYIAILDDSTTDTCENLNGKVVGMDGEAVRMPPFHYNCRTRARSLGDREMQRYGLAVSPHSVYDAHPIEKGFDSPPGTPWEPDTSKYDADIAKGLKAELKKGR